MHGIPLWRAGPDWEVKSRRRRRGVNLHVITIACVRPYITGCRRPWLETDAQFTVRKDTRREKEACWTSDKSVPGLDQDLDTKSYFLKFVTFFTQKNTTKQGTHSFFFSSSSFFLNLSSRIGLTLHNGTGGLLYSPPRTRISSHILSCDFIFLL